MESRTIKGIGKDKWILFKTLASKKNLALGRLFETMVEDYAKRSDFVWKKVLSGERILSDKEAMELEKAVKEVRKERGFRI